MEPGRSPVGLLIAAIAATGAAIGITVWALASRTRGEEELPVELGLNLDPASTSLGPGQIYEGGYIDITTVVTNYGQRSADFDIVYLVNGAEVHRYSSRTLAAGSMESYTYRYHVPAIGTYNVLVTVDGIEASGSFIAVLAPVPEADFIADEDAPVADYFLDQAYGSITIFNVGDAPGEYELEWYIDDTLVWTDTGYLEAGSHEIQEVYIADSDFPLAAGIHNMHCLLKWNGHEQRYPSGYRWYNTFEKP